MANDPRPPSASKIVLARAVLETLQEFPAAIWAHRYWFLAPVATALLVAGLAMWLSSTPAMMAVYSLF